MLCWAPSVAAQPLKVGMAVRSMPCTFFPNGQWHGSFYEIWSAVASNANLPFEVVSVPNFPQLLEAGQTGQVDVAVGCVNMTPDRIAKYRFSLPVQEDGISVLVRKEQTQTWLPIVRALVSPEVLELLGGFVGFVLAIACLIWRIEGYSRQPSTADTGRPRTFIRMFQVLLTGPGTNVLAMSVRANMLISVVYFVRVVSASVLVSLVSIHIIQRSTEEPASRVAVVQDLWGKTVAVGAGSVSEQWVEGHNRTLAGASKETQINLLQTDSVEHAWEALLSRKVDAVIADNLEIQYYHTKLNPRARVQVAIRNIHRQSQGLILSPNLPPETELRINQAIARLKENGTIDTIKDRWLPD